MGKEIRFMGEEDRFERLKAVKERRGYTWKGLMLEGVAVLDTEDVVESDRRPATVTVDAQGGRRDSSAP